MNPQYKNISLLLLTKNSTDKLKKHWNWLSKAPNIDEIILVDDNSTDDTLKTAKSIFSEISLKTFEKKLQNNFADQRKFGLSKAKNDWILWLDSDETPSPEMIEFLKNFNFDSKFSYAFKRVDNFLGTTLLHGETANQTFIRLFNQNKGEFMHPVHEIWNSTVPIKETGVAIYHYSPDSIQNFMEKINFYSSLRAGELYRQKVPSGILSIIFYPLAKFIQNYIFHLGFLDSTAGIILALGMSFHSFLVRSKLWQLWHQ